MTFVDACAGIIAASTFYLALAFAQWRAEEASARAAAQARLDVRLSRKREALDASAAADLETLYSADSRAGAR